MEIRDRVKEEERQERERSTKAEITKMQIVEVKRGAGHGEGSKRKTFI